MINHQNGIQPYQLEGETIYLLPEKAVYWEAKQMLIVTDLHLGKAGHFRKAGIPIPAAVHRHDLEILTQLLEKHEVESVLLLGDLFHAALNNEWWDFERLLDTFSKVQFILVKGNHDILPEAAYRLPNLEVHEDVLKMAPFVFCHIPPEKNQQTEGYYISGHIHPGIRIIGKRLPCFFFGPEGGILPAFGRFTGSVNMKVRNKDRVFAVLPASEGQGKVIDFQ